MKTLMLAGAAAAVLIAIPALAQYPASNGPMALGEMAQPMTRAAVQAKVQAGFARADADRDGFVTQDEVQARGEANRSERQARRVSRKAEIFARLDANRDGSISRAEFDAPRAAMGGASTERRAERRGAGMERHAERMERRSAARGQRGGAMMGRIGGRGFAMLDADKDGRVSMAEASSRALAMFDRIDANRDGTVTMEERAAARGMMRGQRQQRRGG